MYFTHRLSVHWLVTVLRKAFCCTHFKYENTAYVLQVLKGHTNLALAEAQSITVLRAIQKGNAPGLIAGLANDTMQLYQSAAQYLRQALPDSQSSKSSTYADWKALVFQAYAFAYTGKLGQAYSSQPLLRCQSRNLVLLQVHDNLSKVACCCVVHALKGQWHICMLLCCAYSSRTTMASKGCFTVQ